MSEYRPNRISRYVQMFAALSNPNRVAIFLRLASSYCKPGDICSPREMDLCVGDLGKYVGIAPSTVSQHLKIMNRAGLITMERHGKVVKCRVDPDAVKELGDFFDGAVKKRSPVPGRNRKRD